MTNRLPLIAAAFLALATGCAATGRNLTTGSDMPQYRLVVRVPASSVTKIRTQEEKFTFVMVTRSWKKGADHYYETAPTYCLDEAEGGGLTCLANVRYPNVKFDVRPTWQQPNYDTMPAAERAALALRWETDTAYRQEMSKRHHPSDLCGTMRIGITVGGFSFSGGRPAAAYWIDLEPSFNDKGCQYTINSATFAAASAVVKARHYVNDILTE